MQYIQLSAYRPTAARINLTAFHENVLQLKQHANKSMLMAVVKTNAYGHGIVPISREAARAGADCLGVSTVEEGALLRENGITLPIHLLGTVPSGQAQAIVIYQLTASISSLSLARAISAAAEKHDTVAAVHLKIDTGLHRFGVTPGEAADFCEACKSLPGLAWEGIYTHFSSADEGDWDTTKSQFSLFMHTVEKLQRKGFSFPVKHVGGSSIALERKDMHLDMIRPGIALFGYPPAERQRNIIPLRPVLTLKTQIIQLHDLPPDTPVGYGGEYVTTGQEKIAVIPIGMGDGYHKSLTGKGEMLAGGKRARVTAVSLDQTLLHVTAAENLAAGDDIVVLGRQKDGIITARDIAGWMDSITDEVLAGLTERVRRIYVYDDSRMN